jgi:hypothetical protein
MRAREMLLASLPLEASSGTVPYESGNLGLGKCFLLSY